MDLPALMMKSHYKGFAPPLRAKAGFTLIEVVLAVGILVFVLCGILATYISCFELIATSKNMTLATNAAQRRIEEIRDYNFYNIYNDYNNQTFTVDEIAPGNSKGVIRIINLPGTSDILAVVVSVSWRQRGNRIIGGDRNLNGVLDTGEPFVTIYSTNIIDSPVELVTLITPR